MRLTVPTSHSGSTPFIITPASKLSIGQQMASTPVAAATSGAYPITNLAIYVPFNLLESVEVVKTFCLNGATVSGNIDMGIYDAAGTRLVSIGSTAQSGINAIQAFDIADTTIGPGRFYMAVAMDNATGTLLRWFAPTLAVEVLTWGLVQQTAAFALPATATFATFGTRNYCPYIGLSIRVV